MLVNRVLFYKEFFYRIFRFLVFIFLNFRTLFVKFPFVILLFSLLFIPSFCQAKCHGRFANPIEHVCWSCLFPITIGKIAVSKGTLPDTDNPSSPICICPGVPPRPGIAIGYWEPIALVDVTREPFCLVTLGGVKLDVGNFPKGKIDKVTEGHRDSFYHTHWTIFPLMFWLNVITDIACVDKGQLEIPFLSELDPTWNDDEWNLVLNPEAALFGSLPAQAACMADAAKSSLGGLPIDTLFWCVGAQGGIYPLTGHVTAHVGGVDASTLLAERVAYKLHRLGTLYDSDEGNLCKSRYKPVMPKSRYRYQMVYPKPTVSGKKCCYPFGHTTGLWGAMREYPYKGEDFGYLIWRKRNCCLG